MDEPEIARLRQWLADAGVPIAGVPTITLIAGGRSNLTYRVADDAGRVYVLRRPPTGTNLPGAHDVAREFTILSRLQGSVVPLPTLHGLCADVSVIGAPFYVMDFVDGFILTTDADGAQFPVDARAAATSDLVDALGAIHELDVDAVGLGDLGKRENYLQRQLDRWRKQFHSATDRSLPIIDEVWSRLNATQPPQRYTGLVHGDFRFGNVILSPGGSVRAVLDWELCTLGDTLADLGWMTALWREVGEPELSRSPTGHPGYPGRDAVIALYEARTGRDVSDIGWYQAFALWRLACIGEGIYARYRDGAMGGDELDVQAQRDHVVVLAEAAAALA